MENMEIKDYIDKKFWKNKKVFITGHTGFKGSWLSLWLHSLGAEVKGYSLEPPTNPSLFNELNLNNDILSEINDIRDFEKIKNSICEFKPEIIFHLAAQPLVRYSYSNPIETYETNVMGTMNILESIKNCNSIKSAVFITTDKCYENKEWYWSYRENDEMGGHDPYSSSKGCAEILISSFKRSFFSDLSSCGIATARAGNIIGGGDWSTDRLIPDILESYKSNQPIKIRNINAIRPWQYILEPLRGYLLLAENLYLHKDNFSEPFNFGPNESDIKSVGWIFNKMNKVLDENLSMINDSKDNVHEAQLLKLDCSKALMKLNWKPIYNIETTIKKITHWYKSWLAGENTKEICLQYLKEYENHWE